MYCKSSESNSYMLTHCAKHLPQSCDVHTSVSCPKLWQQMNKELALKERSGGKRDVTTPINSVKERAAAQKQKNARGKHPETILGGGRQRFFFNPCEAKRLNGNFPLSGTMQRPYHCLCLTLMCFERARPQKAASPHARTHTALQPFSRLHSVLDLCCKDMVFQKSCLYCCSHSTLHVHNLKRHFNFKSDSQVPPHIHLPFTVLIWLCLYFPQCYVRRCM